MANSHSLGFAFFVKAVKGTLHTTYYLGMYIHCLWKNAKKHKLHNFQSCEKLFLKRQGSYTIWELHLSCTNAKNIRIYSQWIDSMATFPETTGVEKSTLCREILIKRKKNEPSKFWPNFLNNAVYG